MPSGDAMSTPSATDRTPQAGHARRSQSDTGRRSPQPSGGHPRTACPSGPSAAATSPRSTTTGHPTGSETATPTSLSARPRPICQTRPSKPSSGRPLSAQSLAERAAERAAVHERLPHDRRPAAGAGFVFAPVDVQRAIEVARLHDFVTLRSPTCAELHRQQLRPSADRELCLFPLSDRVETPPGNAANERHLAPWSVQRRTAERISQHCPGHQLVAITQDDRRRRAPFGEGVRFRPLEIAPGERRRVRARQFSSALSLSAIMPNHAPVLVARRAVFSHHSPIAA